MKRMSIVVFCLLTLALGAYAFQNPQDQGKGERGGRMGRGPMSVDDHVKYLTSKLQLTDDQSAKVKAILEDQRQQAQTLMRDDSLSQEDKRSKMRSLREASASKIRDLLNEDQKKVYDQMEKERREHMRERQKAEVNNPST